VHGLGKGGPSVRCPTYAIALASHFGTRDHFRISLDLPLRATTRHGCWSQPFSACFAREMKPNHATPVCVSSSNLHARVAHALRATCSAVANSRAIDPNFLSRIEIEPSLYARPT
jgi:hypothetical protein